MIFDKKYWKRNLKIYFEVKFWDMKKLHQSHYAKTAIKSLQEM